MPSDDVRILIVGESPLARAGLAALLAIHPELTVVGQLAADAEFTTTAPAFRADAIVWDMGWDAQRALELLVDVKDSVAPVLALVADETRAGDTLSAGARGLLLQNTDSETLAIGLTAVARGLMVLPPDLASAALPGIVHSIAAPTETLTAREQEVLSLVAEGLPNKIIAARLGISEHTVKFHVNAVMTKLGAQSRTEAVVMATRLGLIVL